MTATVGLGIDDGSGPLGVRWGPVRRRVLWLVVVSAGGLLAGPLMNVVVRRLIPAGGGGEWGGLAGAAAVVSAAVLVACGAGLAVLTEELFMLAPGRCWLLVAAVWGLGGIPWLLPLNLSLPAHAGSGVEGVAGLAMVVPFALIAVSVCPGVGRPYRLAALLACAGLAAGWPALSIGLVHRAAGGERAALGAPAAMYLLVNVPGHVPYPYTYTDRVLQADYEAPGLSSPMRDTDDLLLTVCPSSDPGDCAWGRASIVSGDTSLSCGPESGGLWRCADQADQYADTMLAARYDGLYVSLTVDPASDTPVPASELDSIIKTLHRADDRDLLDVMSG